MKMRLPILYLAVLFGVLSAAPSDIEPSDDGQIDDGDYRESLVRVKRQDLRVIGGSFSLSSSSSNKPSQDAFDDPKATTSDAASPPRGISFGGSGQSFGSGQQQSFGSGQRPSFGGSGQSFGGSGSRPSFPSIQIPHHSQQSHGFPGFGGSQGRPQHGGFGTQQGSPQQGGFEISHTPAPGNSGVNFGQGGGINCRKRRNRDRPECQHLNFGGGGQEVDCSRRRNRDRPECAGEVTGEVDCSRRRNRNRPECISATPAEEVNCNRKRFRNHPSCQAPSESPDDPDIQLNCQGNRKRRRNCQNQLANHPSCQGDKKWKKNCLGTGEVSQAIELINWLPNLLQPDQTSLVIPNLPKTPSTPSAENRFLLGTTLPDTPYQACPAPRPQSSSVERGHCRHLHHCILPVFINDFSLFLKFVCFIEGRYLGVCCPDSRYPEQPPPPPPSTTAATTTTRPPVTVDPKRSCGVNSIQQTRIVGGSDAKINEFPWAAALLRNSEDTSYCGGCLITRRHVLTAAHCVDGFSPTSIRVRLGEYTFDHQSNTQHKDFQLARINMHEQYDTSTYVNDIAILTLDRTTEFSHEIWPVCLPPPSELFINKVATVIGWGTIYYGGPVDTTLQKVTLPIWTNDECNAAYPNNEIFPQNLCAGIKTGGKDSCQGDSGGPLLYNDRGKYFTIGVVSWGIRCAEPGRPGVYARVNQYLGWIDNIIGPDKPTF